jgi:hypothetical protein
MLIGIVPNTKHTNIIISTLIRNVRGTCRKGKKHEISKIKIIELISRTISCDALEGPNVYKNFAFEILDKLSKYDQGRFHVML